ncbi:MAG: D-alanine--D-alanine ligase [Bdellovibrionota bacterium]
MKPKKVWVLYGGESAEHDVSVKTGANIVAALKAKGFEVTALPFKSRDQIPSFFAQTKPDIVFLGLHGTFGEDGVIQGFLETIKVPYVGSGVLSSALCFNKLTTQKILKHHKIPVASFLELQRNTFSVQDLVKAEPRFLEKKYFIKAASQGSTLGVYRYNPADYVEAEKKEAFEDLCAKAFQFDSELIVEDWIEGRELTVPVVFSQAFPVIEIRPNSKFYDYQSKYTAGETEYLCPAPIEKEITQKVQSCSEEVSKVLKCQDYVRVDFILKDSGDFVVLEANTLPGMTATSLVPKSAKAKGIDFESFIEMLVLKSYERQTQ